MRREIKLASKVIFPLLFALPNISTAQTAKTYSGIDPNGSEVVPLSRWPNSNRAEKEFLGNLSDNVGIQTFEQVPTGTTSVPDPVRLVFSKPGQKVLSGELSGGNGTLFSVEEGSTYKGNYGTSPTKFWSIVTGEGGNFKIKFDKPIAALGFNGIDIGDFDGILDVTTFKDGKQVKTYQIPLAPGTEAYGSVLFYGIVEDEEGQFDTIEFSSFNQGAISDIFSFDNIVAAYFSQINDLYSRMYKASLQPYAANPQLILNSTQSIQNSLLATAGKCDRYGWVLDEIDVTSPTFQYLHGKVNNDWKLCIFGEGGKDWASFDGDNTYGGYNVTSTFFRGGAEVRIGRSFILGAAYGYGSPYLDNFNFEDTTASVRNTLSLGSLYLTYQPDDHWNFTVLGSVGTANSTANREYSFTDSLNVSANSAWSSSVRGLALDVGYEYYFAKKKTRLSPMIKPSISYQWIKSDSPQISESGSGQLATIQPYLVSGNILSFNLAYEHPIKLDADGLALFIPKLFFSYQYNSTGGDNSLYTITARDKETGQYYSTSSLLFGSSRASVSLYGDLNLSDSFTLYLGTSYILYGAGSGYSIEGGLRVRM